MVKKDFADILWPGGIRRRELLGERCHGLRSSVQLLGSRVHSTRPHILCGGGEICRYFVAL